MDITNLKPSKLLSLALKDLELCEKGPSLPHRYVELAPPLMVSA